MSLSVIMPMPNAERYVRAAVGRCPRLLDCQHRIEVNLV